ncbi:MAG: ABC transporter ATP-binding protein [Deltaproteobacteria bacterium]|nr:ABC transporter ATP-binding protein [Deltaproteobacteria bacterium]
MNSEQILLEVKHIEVRRGGVRVLEVPQFSLRQGEVVCLVGPNGSGKSTLLLTLCCLLERQAGALLFKSLPVAGRRSILEFRRSTATVFQEPLLFDTTVYDNVASGLKIRGLSRQEIRLRVEQNLDRFRIGHLAGRAARKLSGGEAQRASLARALATEPEILFLDEPFSALDPPTREALLDDLEGIFRDTGIAVVMASHDQAEALRLADTMAVMRQGRLAQVGAPADVMNFPADEFVASFVGMGTVLKGRVLQTEQDTVQVAIGDKIIECVGQAAAGRQVILCVRPENVTLALPGCHDGDSARNHFSGTIARIIPMGHFLKVELDCGFFLSTHITHHSREALGLAEGSAVAASFKATAVHMIPHA